jgi:predicted transcriptional regulator
MVLLHPATSSIIQASSKHEDIFNISANHQPKKEKREIAKQLNVANQANPTLSIKSSQ